MALALTASSAVGMRRFCPSLALLQRDGVVDRRDGDLVGRHALAVPAGCRRRAVRPALLQAVEIGRLHRATLSDAPGLGQHGRSARCLQPALRAGLPTPATRPWQTVRALLKFLASNAGGAHAGSRWARRRSAAGSHLV